MPTTGQLPIFRGPLWLSQLIDHAERSDACLDTGCTTCGCLPFREAVHASLKACVGDHPGAELDELIDQLCRFRVEEGGYRAVQVLVRSITSGEFGDIPEDRLQDRLGATDAGGMLRAMRARSARANLDRAKREAEQSPETVEARRAVKRAAAAERHRARLAEKAAREASPEWRQRFGHLIPSPPAGSP